MPTRACSAATCAIVSSSIAPASELDSSEMVGDGHGHQEKRFAIVERGTEGAVHRQGARRAAVPSKRSGPRARGEGHVRAERPHRLAQSSTGSDAHCDGRPRLRREVGALASKPAKPIGRYASGKFLLLGLGSALTFGSRNGRSAPHPHLYEVAYANHGFKETD